MRACFSLTTAALLAAMLAACQPGADRGASAQPETGAATAASGTPQPSSAGPDAAPGAAFDAIKPDETITLVGTEPFWGGTIKGGQLNYSTPENQPDEAVAVKRFAGKNGLGFSGPWHGDTLDLTITPGACSDGMSDRTYPYTVTLRLGPEQREGCAWTDRQHYSGPE